MPGKYLNSLKTARLDAHLTQEQAAEAAGVSLESWKAYEYGDRLPPQEILVRICDGLDAPWLALEYIKLSAAPLGILPEDLRVQGITTAVLTLIDRAKELEADYWRLIGIAADGMIDAQERPEFDEIAQDILSVAAACLQVVYAREDTPPGTKKERPEAGTSKRSVQGLSTENDCKIIIPHRRPKATPKFARGEVQHV